MKKVIFSAMFLLVATFAMAQSSTKNVEALKVLEVTPTVYAQNVQSELQTVCNLKPEQAEQVYEIALKTAKKVHELETYNNTAGNPDHADHMKRTLQYGEAYIMNILTKNQLASYAKKDRILRKQELIRERQALSKKSESKN